MKKRVKLLQLGILCLVSLFVVLIANYSYSKYTMNQQDHLTGTYVDFRLSHNGDGQVALMSEVENSTDETEYIGYITLSVINKKDDKVSQRELAFTLREPTAKDPTSGEDGELENGKITDIWGKSFSLNDPNDKSEFYEMEIVKADGSSYLESEKTDINGEYYQNTTFEAKQEKENHLTLKIKRLKSSRNTNHSGVTPGELTNVEEITVVLETSKPYTTTSIFKIRVSNSLIFMNATKTTYFGFNDVNVNIKTAKEYNFQTKNATGSTNQQTSPYPVKIKLTYDEGSILDFERFRLEVEDQYTSIETLDVSKVGYQYENGSHSIILQVPMGSSINLHFYISTNSVISETATFFYDDGGVQKDFDYTKDVAGIKTIDENGLKYVYHYTLD